MRGRQLGEADRIFTLFTLERGKLDAVAKGVRRSRSHFAGRLEFLNECDFMMHRGRSLEIIVSAETRTAPWTRLVEPARYAVASVLAELIDAFCEPDLALPDVYELVTGAVGALVVATEPRDLLPRFSLRLLEMLGLAPPLESCVRCGRSLPAGSAWLDAESGGVVDAACKERWRDLPELQEHDLENLRALSRPKHERAALLATPVAAAAIDELVAHHLGKRPKAIAQLGTL
ncbi:MAG TPA: DNA repair protein RecO [Candidatus Cybelea sp.]